MKKVSVIIPVFNQEKLIRKCLESIPKRDDIEIIVVNDGSTDKTMGYLKNFKAFGNKDLIIIDYGENKGVSYARNAGIEASSGEYLVFIDSDDYIYPKVFNKIVDNYLDGENQLVFYDLENNAKYRFEATQENYKCKYGNFKFIKREFLGDLIYTEGKQYAEDKELHLKLMEKYPKCYFTNEVMYHYNYPRKGSLSAIGENR
ncbi:MAG: glycosyltransferase family 2 protein [Candidatus Gastranaerophilales bacterium]|nr:glycosyltransferase family 2 protein [Candidatus Gastranaerophilales bacterium]